MSKPSTPGKPYIQKREVRVSARQSQRRIAVSCRKYVESLAYKMMLQDFTNRSVVFCDDHL